MNLKSILAFATILFIITPSTGVAAIPIADDTIPIPPSFFHRIEFSIDQDNTPVSTTVTINDGVGIDLFILDNFWAVPDPTWVSYLGERKAPFNNETFYVLNGTAELVQSPNLLDNQVEFRSHNITQGNSVEFTIELDEGPYWMYLWNRDFDFVIGNPSDTTVCIDTTPAHPVFDCIIRYGQATTVTIKSDVDNPTNFVTLFLLLAGFIALVSLIIWKVKGALSNNS